MAGENRNGVVELDFGDGTHRFRLPIGQLEELQEKTGVGPFKLLQRLLNGEWHVADVREPIRLGLIGGGMEPLAALTLVRRYIDDRHDWLPQSITARLIVMAAISGAPEEEPGKDDASEDETGAPFSQTDDLPSATFTGQPLPQA